MRAELTKGQESVVFVWNIHLGTSAYYVKVCTYDGARSVSNIKYKIELARECWKNLVAHGFHAIPETLL